MGRTDELDPSLGGGSSPERPDLRINLPTVEEQQEIIAEAEADKTSAFTISQEDIDAVLTRGSGIYHGKYRIYEQYLKKESAESNITFLKNEYGVGGAYPAVGDRNLDESHDPKGIKISRGRIMQPDAEVTLKWNKVEKRIGELIDAGRYLSVMEVEHYPVYHAQEEARKARWAISNEFRSIVDDYNDFVEQLGEEDKKLNLYYLSGCWGAFGVGDKKMHNRTAEGDFILPMMREAMNQIIADNTHLTERCEAMLESLSSDIAKPFEPTYDELNPPPEPKKEYRFSLGDTVYLGTQEYEVLSFDESEVVLFDTQFPLFNKTLPREEFDNRLKENPLNDKLLQIVEEAPVVDNTLARISLDSGNDQVHWIYFNPDAAAGGQYVSGDLDFSVFEELVEQYDIANHPENSDAFRNDLGEIDDFPKNISEKRLDAAALKVSESMEKERVRIRDIAEELGLSTATVSNVIHGKTKKISEETVRRVQALLEERQYIPNMAGILLAQNDSKIIGVVIHDHRKYEDHVLEDGFIAASVNALAKELDKAAGLFCCVLSNLFNLIRSMLSK